MKMEGLPCKVNQAGRPKSPWATLDLPVCLSLQRQDQVMLQYSCLRPQRPSSLPPLMGDILSYSIFRVCSTLREEDTLWHWFAIWPLPQSLRYFYDGVFHFCVLSAGLWHMFTEERRGQRKISQARSTVFTELCLLYQG